MTAQTLNAKIRPIAVVEEAPAGSTLVRYAEWNGREYVPAERWLRDWTDVQRAETAAADERLRARNAKYAPEFDAALARLAAARNVNLEEVG